MTVWFICCWQNSIKAIYATIIGTLAPPCIFASEKKNQIGYVIFQNNSQGFTSTIQAKESLDFPRVKKKK